MITAMIGLEDCISPSNVSSYAENKTVSADMPLACQKPWEEEEESVELHRSPNETQQTHGLAYQSADGRTVIWLHPDVQMDQLSAAGFQPQITLMGQSAENTQEDTTLVPGKQKDEETILGMVEEVIEAEDNTALSSEDALKTDEASSGERLHISESFAADSEEHKEDVILTNSGEVCQIVTVVTSAEAFKEKSEINSVPKMSFVNPPPSTITVSSPQKAVMTLPLKLTHSSSSHKSKKSRPKKKCKHSSDNDDSFQSKPYRNSAHHKIDSQVEESTCMARGCCELHKEDSFDHFGKYMATLLRNLPSRKSACRLQKEMINWVLKEQMLFMED